MALAPVKCTQCGANVTVDTTGTGVCEFCGTALVIIPADEAVPNGPEKESLLTRVRRNLVIETDVFLRYGMTFHCHLVEECDTLQLNFELSKTKQLASKMNKDAFFIIKANVYDANGNLLCMEEEFVEYRQLRRGYAADYFCFSSDSMSEAHSMKVYAIDPTEEYEEDNAFDDEWESPRGSAQPIRNEDREGPPPKKYDWKMKETWEDYPAPNYDDVHTYCRVAFDGERKTFYYRTRNPELKVGDNVYVPVGYKYQKKIGTIVSMKEYVGRKAPYPLEKTKFIIGKAEDK